MHGGTFGTARAQKAIALAERLGVPADRAVVRVRSQRTVSEEPPCER